MVNSAITFGIYCAIFKVIYIQIQYSQNTHSPNTNPNATKIHSSANLVQHVSEFGEHSHEKQYIFKYAQIKVIFKHKEIKSHIQN